MYYKIRSCLSLKTQLVINLIMNKNKGFTLIELLVVIAIIGILASVVLASLNTARAKGADAAIKSNLTNIRASAEMVYDSATPNSYVNVCVDPTVVRGVAAAAKAGGTTAWTSATNNAGDIACISSSSGWVAYAKLKGAGMYCADNTGLGLVISAVTLPIATTVACPTS